MLQANWVAVPVTSPRLPFRAKALLFLCNQEQREPSRKEDEDPACRGSIQAPTTIP